MTKTNSSKAFEERYKNLNLAQKRAVDTVDGPVLVVAGPGSGKTELLALRTANILRIGQARASNILCLTFTETASLNMRQRLQTLIGTDAYRTAIYTFHGFCTDIIGRYPEYFYNASNMSPASDLVQSELLEGIFEKLPHKHILGGFLPERGFSYLKEVQTRIKDIKKGGLSPERFREIIQENEKAFQLLNPILADLLPERISKTSPGPFETMRQSLLQSKTNLGAMYAKIIEHSLSDCDVSEKTTPLSDWKSKYTSKDEKGIRVFKESLSTNKLLALADIYGEYQDALLRGGYFDYEDMIMQVVDSLYKNETLRTEIEEKYQYIMVDEFQDTNNVQLSLIKALSSNEVHEGRANVCVVGDDDQAVYKFQGAEISNIHSFKELYKDVETIVLVENYRSTQKILNYARAVVLQGVNRLETRYKEIRKDLTAKNESLPAGEIHTLSFPTQEEEFSYIGDELKKLLDSGVPAKEIAIISREHKQLISLLPYLDGLQIPYTYTRKENVFDEIHVKELITLCRFLSTVGSSNLERDDLLPEILAFPFWGISRINIWEIAEVAKTKNITWLKSMLISDDIKIKTMANFFIELGILSQTSPLEIILDTLIGSKDLPKVGDSPDDDDIHTPQELSLETNFMSPYKTYYFGENVFKENVSSYIHFLSSLRVFIHALREYKEGKLLRVSDVGNFVDMHTSYKIPLINETPFAHNENSVSLLTSHKAKGLEFSYVFVISVNDSIWAGSGKRSLLSFPINLPLASIGDTEDDYIRLFYVALTRARHTLYITHHNSPLRFLVSSTMPDTNTVAPKMKIPELIVAGLAIHHPAPFAHDEKALLSKMVEGYMLSPTHLNNFLNIIDGGPMFFIEQNLLRFPQAKSVSSVYGSAIHKALENAHILAKKNGKIATLANIVDTFTYELKKGRLLSYEFDKQLTRGIKILSRYYELKQNDLAKGHIVELNFAKQSVMIEGALFTGKIDKIIESEDHSWTVVDFKTGKGVHSWDEPKQKEYGLVKLHNYRHQLMMYKLLVENSRDFNNHVVSTGVLEFVEEEATGNIESIELSFNDKEVKEELLGFKNLAVKVYEKIMSLDFPDTSSYPKTLDGIKAFEEDLKTGKI